MAYFRQNEPYQNPLPDEPAEEEQEEIDPEEELLFFDSEYENGPDEPEEEEAELTEEELFQYRKHRIRMLFNAGNMTGILIGCVLILLLMTLLLSMVSFVMKDFNHSFSLLQIKF